METVNVTIKMSEKDLKSFCVEKQYLDRLITNIKLYEKDFEFISEFIKQYSEAQCQEFLPSDEGIIFIDMTSNIILDSQGITGVNKVTPSEVKRSKRGKIPDETTKNSTLSRFMHLFDAGYLKGFDEWRNSGHHLNTSILKLDYNEVMDLIMETNYHYGQFVFSTKPFKVETFNEIDCEEQRMLYNRASGLRLIPLHKVEEWEVYLQNLV